MGNGLDILMSAATIDTSNRWNQLSLVRGAGWHRALTDNKVYGTDEHNWCYYVPLMISTHLYLEHRLSEDDYEIPVAKFLCGKSGAQFPLNDALLIIGLAEAYQSLEGMNDDISAALCEKIYRNLYRVQDADGRGSRQISMGLSTTLWNELHDLQDKSWDYIAKVCLTKRGVPSMFTNGGLHVGLVLANYTMWYKGYKFLSADGDRRWTLDPLAVQNQQGIDESSPYWEELIRVCMASAFDFDGERYVSHIN